MPLRESRRSRAAAIGTAGQKCLARNNSSWFCWCRIYHHIYYAPAVVGAYLKYKGSGTSDLGKHSLLDVIADWGALPQAAALALLDMTV
jgi:hypothetical protein